MRSRGYEKPILVGECNGPLLIQHPEALAALAEVWQSGATEPWHRMSVEQFREGKLSATPARNAMKRLYQRMDELPPALQMFMTGCPDGLEALRHRLNARDIVIRTLLALSYGVQRTACWQIRPDDPTPPEPYEFLNLMFSKFQLLPPDDRGDARFPAAGAFTGLAVPVTDADSVRRIEVPHQPDVHVFEIIRDDRAATRVAWLRHDGITEDHPPPRHINACGVNVTADPAFVDLTTTGVSGPGT